MKTHLLTFFATAVACFAQEAALERTPEGLGRVTWDVQAGTTFAVEFSDNLSDWLTAPDLPEISSDGTKYSQTIFHAPADRQFFRLTERPDNVYEVSTAPAVLGEEQQMTFVDQGRLRRYLIYLPSSYSAPAPANRGCDDGFPLAIICHGSGQTARSFADLHPVLITYCDLQEVILIIGQGTFNDQNSKYSWNSVDADFRVDDVVYIQNLIADLKEDLWIDRDRIYIGGFSNGGIFSQRAIATSPGNFAAFMVVGSALGGQAGQQGPDSPIIRIPEPFDRHSAPAMLVAGFADDARPYFGGPSEGDGPLQTPAPEMRDFWYGALGCTDTFTTTPITYPSGANSGMLESACEGTEQEVNFYTVTDLTHEWPDANDNVGFNANTRTIDFFLSHEREGVEDTADPSPVSPPASWTRTTFQGRDAIYHVPAAPTAMVFVAHGAGADVNFVDSIEMVEILEGLAAEGIGFCALSSENRVAGTWDLTKAGNADLDRVADLFSDVLMTDVPVIPSGFGEGGHFAVLAAEVLNGPGMTIGGRALLNTPLGAGTPQTVLDALSASEEPMFVATAENDAIAGVLSSWTEFRKLSVYGNEAQRASSDYFPSRRKVLTSGRLMRVPGVTLAEANALIPTLQSANYINAAGHPTICPDELDCSTIPMPPALTNAEKSGLRRQICTALAGHAPDAACLDKLRRFSIAVRRVEDQDPPGIPTAAAVDPNSVAPVPDVMWTFSGMFQTFPVRAFIPPSPDGLVYFFHGTTDGIDFYERLEQREMIHALHAANIGVVCTESTNRDNLNLPGARWETRSFHPNTDAVYVDNVDWVRLMALRDTLITSTGVSANTPLFSMGFSSGGGFALTFGFLAQQAGMDFRGIAVHAEGAIEDGAYRAARRLTAGTPIFLTVLANDDVAAQMPGFSDMLTELGHNVSYHVGEELLLTPDRFLRIPGTTSQEANATFNTLVSDGVIDSTGLRQIELSEELSLSDEAQERQVRATIMSDHLFSSRFVDEEILWFETLVP